MPRTSIYAKQVVAPRFSAWASNALEESGASVFRLSQAWQECLNGRVPTGDKVPRRLTRRHLDGVQTPSAESVKAYGEAFRILGLNWSSAPVALYAAGYFSEFAQCLLILEGPESIDLILRLLFASPYAISAAVASDEREAARSFLVMSDAERYIEKQRFSLWKSAGKKRRELIVNSSSDLLRLIAYSASMEANISAIRKEDLIRMIGELWYSDRIRSPLNRYLHQFMSNPIPRPIPDLDLKAHMIKLIEKSRKEWIESE